MFASLHLNIFPSTACMYRVSHKTHDSKIRIKDCLLSLTKDRQNVELKKLHDISAFKSKFHYDKPLIHLTFLIQIHWIAVKLSKLFLHCHINCDTLYVFNAIYTVK